MRCGMYNGKYHSILLTCDCTLIENAMTSGALTGTSGKVGTTSGGALNGG